MKTLMINAMVLIVAGSDTSATLLSGLIYLLLKNPGCLQKITHEVRSAFKSEDEISFSSVQSLPYSMFYQALYIPKTCPRLAQFTRNLTLSLGSARLYQGDLPTLSTRAGLHAPCCSKRRREYRRPFRAGRDHRERCAVADVPQR